MAKSHQSHQSHHEITRRVTNVCDVIFLKEITFHITSHISHQGEGNE